jgi:hypothetical protein
VGWGVLDLVILGGIFLLGFCFECLGVLGFETCVMSIDVLRFLR